MKSTFRSLAVLSLLLFGVFAASFLAPASAQAARIWVDAGHGGSDPGAVLGNIHEKDLNLAIAKELAAELSRRGHTVGQTRTTDVTTNLYDRPARANDWGADAFISVHCNTSSSGSAFGPLVIYQDSSFATSAVSKTLAENIQNAVKPVMGGATSANIADRGFVVINRAKMPSVIVECGFISNLSDRYKLTDPATQKRIAVAIADGIDKSIPKTDVPNTRLAGTQRFETAAAIARAGWPSGSDTVVMVNGEVWPDALTAAGLAGKYNAPILLCSDRDVPTVTINTIKALKPSHIIVVGGTGPVPDSVANAALYAARSASVMSMSAFGTLDALEAPSAEPSVSPEATPTPDPAMSPQPEASPQDHETAEESPTPSADTSASAGAEKDVNAGGLTPFALQAASVPTLERIAGIDRYETSALVARRIGIPTAGAGANTVMLVSGETFPDAVSASATAATYKLPLLFVKREAIPPQVASYLSANNSAIGKVELVGGTGVISAQVVTASSTYGTPHRSGGIDRYATSVLIGQRFIGSAKPLAFAVANGNDFPDALVAGPFVNRIGSNAVLVTTSPSIFNPSAGPWLKPAVAQSTFKNVYLMGGTGVLPPSLVDSIKKSVGK